MSSNEGHRLPVQSRHHKLEPPSSGHHRAAQLLRVTSPTVPLFFLGFMHYKRRCKIRAPCSKGMSGLLTQEMPVALMCSVWWWRRLRSSYMVEGAEIVLEPHKMGS
ncbi:hypothetical protein CIPAW_06G017500 [Carya illinoinensis]|uniref:Uncharacterized protein n=1 Tax=Carya illinoinensis TaxID=32201 RepID=A0A8T1PZS8_CARIL|nr:hypothetical protein CIPAW_06G017500 [Carya illinoinensis]KAG6650069.1 hypothetical protein CIPAW_06G017500 [Carya illinoinensis]